MELRKFDAATAAEFIKADCKADDIRLFLPDRVASRVSSIQVRESSVANRSDRSLTNGPHMGYKLRISLPYKDAGRVTPSGGASAAPAGGGSSPSRSGGLGKTRPDGIMTGPRVQSRWTGTGKARVTPASDANEGRSAGFA